MDTSRDDVGIAIRSAFLRKGTKERFSLIVLIFLSIFFLFLENINNKAISFSRSLVKDSIYRGSVIVSAPAKSFSYLGGLIKGHIAIYEDYNKLKSENKNLKSKIFKSDFLKLENQQLKELVQEESSFSQNIIISRVMLDKESPYLESFILNKGNNKKIKNGMAVLDGTNFIGRIVDVNFFSSRVLLLTDLNSKIPVIVEPSGYHAILSGHGESNPTLDYLSKNYKLNDGDKVYTSGKEGIFSPGIPIGQVRINKSEIEVLLLSDLTQITYVNVMLKE